MGHRILSGTLILGLGLTFATACSGGQPAVTPLAGHHPSSPPGNLPASGNPLASRPPGPADRSLTGMHACQLVPANVVTQIVGQPLQRPYETSNGLQCIYNTTADGGLSYGLALVTRSNYLVAKEFSEASAENDKGYRFVPGHDLGDDTFSTSGANDPYYTLWAVKGGAGVEVNVQNTGQGPAQAHELVAAALNQL